MLIFGWMYCLMLLFDFGEYCNGIVLYMYNMIGEDGILLVEFWVIGWSEFVVYDDVEVWDICVDCVEVCEDVFGVYFVDGFEFDGCCVIFVIGVVDDLFVFLGL